MIEELILMLAKEAGHDVQDEQAEVYVNGVRGRIDCRIDGPLVDVKSASTFSYAKFKSHGLETDDAFGYLIQLGGYGSVVGDGPTNYFLAVEKTSGELHLDGWPKSKVNFENLVEEKRAVLARQSPPSRGFTDEAMGKSGNRKLGVECRYCDFKKHCWPDLRVFQYANGLSYLTRVIELPRVPEVTNGE